LLFIFKRFSSLSSTSLACSALGTNFAQEWAQPAARNLIIEANIMKATLPVLLTLLLVGAVIFTPLKTNGQTQNGTPKLELDQDNINASDSEDGADDEPVDRVARITFMEGDVSFLRAGVQEWADAAENLPLLAGDQLYVGSRGRVEIQFGRGNYVRLSEKTALTITELSQTAALLEVTEGIAIIRLERYGSAWERFEVDTPNSALVLKQDGIYRVNVRGEKDSEVIVRRGLAEVFADDGDFKLREGQRLTVDTTSNGRLQIAADTSNDDWDRWSYERDRQTDYVAVSSAPDYVSQYETNYNDFYGASDLTSYGSWTSYSDYGHCWVPRVSSGWAPYRSGQWIWIPRAGWSWLSNEPWGWAPYHYGRWVFLNNIGWAWSPGFNTPRYGYGHSYYSWRPALVGFFNCPTPRGNYVGWYPLAPGDRWRRSGNFGGDGFRGNDGHRHLQYPVARDAWRRPNERGGDSAGGRRGGNDLGPSRRHGVTVLPIEGFAGSGRTKFKPGAPDHDLNNYVNTRARLGLPDLGANANSYVNAKVAKSGDAQNSFRPAVKPSQEVMGRSVVTRQRTVDTQAGDAAVAPRQRRFIGVPSLTQGGNDTTNYRKARRNEEVNGGNNRAQGGNSATNDTGSNQPRRNKNADAANGTAGKDSANGVITDETIRKRVGRTIEERPESQKGNGSNRDDNSVTWKNRTRSVPAPNSEGDADANAGRRERANRTNEDRSANGETYHPKGEGQADAEERKARRAERQEQERQQQQQESERQQQQQREQRRAERQEQGRQHQQQEQRQQEQQRQEQEQQRQHEQRRAERQQQQEQEQRRQQQEHEQRRAERQQQEQQRQQQEQQRQQQEQQQRHEEKQRRKNGDN
jgi:hypothetical protein